MARPQSNVIPIDRRPVHSHHEPYELASEFEAHVARCCASSPDFWARVGHAIDPRALGGDPAKLIVNAVRAIAKSSNGRGPSHHDAVLQELAAQSHAGKVTAAQLADVRAVLAASDGPNETEVLAALVPVVRKRARQQAILLAHGEYPKPLGNFAYVRALLERAESIGEAGADPQLAAASGVLTFDDLCAYAGDPDYLIEHWGICAGAPTLLAGSGFTGKSLLLQAFAVAIASGGAAPGNLFTRSGRVLWLDYEQGRRVLGRRFARIAHAAGADPTKLQGQLDAVVMPPPLDGTGAEAWLRAVCAGRALAVVDSFRAACPSSDENDSSETRRVLDMAGRVSEDTGCAVAFIHHARKPQPGEGGGKYAIRGSSGIFDACGAVLCLGDEGEVTHEKNRAGGALARPRQLAITDVADGADPRAGLLVELAGGPAAAVQTTPAETAQAAVLRVLAETPGLSVREVQSAAGGKNDGSTGVAVKQLAQAGRIINRGSDGRPKWHLAEVQTP